MKMIVIIDDNPMDIELATIALEATGREISVYSATDGKSALAMLRNGLGLPALILLDLKMPGMSDIEVFHEIPANIDLGIFPLWWSRLLRWNHMQSPSYQQSVMIAAVLICQCCYCHLAALAIA